MTEHQIKIKGKTYKIRELSWEEDLEIQQKCTTVDGKLNFKELMILRVAKSLVEPKMLTDDVRQLSAKVGSTLNEFWLRINDVDPESFLELAKAQSTSST